MKRSTLLFIVGIMLIAVIAGCSGTANSGKTSGTGASSAPEKVELRMLWWGSQPRHDMTVKVIELFEAKYPHIKVLPEYSGFSGYWDKLSVQVSGGSPPDVIQMSTAYISDYANRNSLMDLSDLGINFEDIDEGTLSTGILNGKQYAVPAGMNAMGFFYDPAMVEKSGIVMPERMTWDDFATFAQQITDTIGEGVVGSTDEISAAELITVFMREKGMSFFKDGKIGFTKEALVEYLTFWDNLRRNGAVPTAEASASYRGVGIEKHPLILNKTAFSSFPANNFAAAVEMAQRPLELALYPTSGEEGSYTFPAMYWSLTAKSAHPEEAALLIDFLINDVEAGKLQGTDRGVPVSGEIRAALQPQLADSDKKLFAFIDKVAQIAKPYNAIDPKGTGEVWDLLKNITQEIQFEKKSIDQAAQEFIEKSNDILEKMK